MTTSDGATMDDAPLASSDQEQPAPAVSTPAEREPGWFMVVGLGVLVACLLAGEALKAALHLVLPGNILGLFILLGLLMTGLVKLRWVEAAARWLLFLLPLLFVPIFVLALKKSLHLPQGAKYFAAVLVGTLLLWACVGHLAQLLLSRTDSMPISDDQRS